MQGREGEVQLVKSGQKRVLSRVCTAWRNSRGLKCYTEVVNVTSALGPSVRSSAEYVHRRMCRRILKGTTAILKVVHQCLRTHTHTCTHMFYAARSLSSPLQKKVEKVVCRGFTESLKASLFPAVSLSRVCLLFSRIFRFSASRTTPVRFEPRVGVSKNECDRQEKPVRSMQLTPPSSLLQSMWQVVLMMVQLARSGIYYRRKFESTFEGQTDFSIYATEFLNKITIRIDFSNNKMFCLH